MRTHKLLPFLLAFATQQACAISQGGQAQAAHLVVDDRELQASTQSQEHPKHGSANSQSRSSRLATLAPTTGPKPEGSPPSGPPPPPPPPSQSFSFQVPLPSQEELESRGSAHRLAALSNAACFQELRKEKLPFSFQGPTYGVSSPVRFNGELDQVAYQVGPVTSPFGLLDCRLALTLHQLREVFAQHGVVRVRIDNFYRKNARLPADRRKRSQHAMALAADVVSFKLKDGTLLDVEADFAGVRGAPVCGPEAGFSRQDDKAIRLRNLVCDIARTGSFHHILTPNYDRAHENHLHMDIKKDNRSLTIH